MSAGVRIIVTNTEGAVLLEFRDARRKNIYDLTFCFFGGGIDEGEEPIQAAIRELEEETGVKAQPQHLRYIVSAAAHPMNDELTHFFRYTKPVELSEVVYAEGAGFAAVEYADFPRIPTAGLMKWFYEKYPELPA